MPKKRKRKHPTFFVTHSLFLAPIITLLLLIIALIVTSHPVVVYNDKARFGDLNLEGKSIYEGTQIMNEKLTEPIYLDLEASSRAVTLAELGIHVDFETLNKLTKRCPYNKLKIFCKNTSASNLSASNTIVVDEQKLNDFLDDFEQNLQYLAGNTIISFSNYSFRPVSSSAKIMLDREIFSSKTKLAELIGQDRISIGLQTTTVDPPEIQEVTANTLINNMTYPLLIKYGGEPVYIPKEVVDSFIKTNVMNGAVYGFIDSGEVAKYLNEIGKEYASDDVKIIKNESIDAIRRVMLFRAADYEINNAVVLPLEGKPKSTGSKATKYLEVIKSQQRLYRFENGKLTKTYIISTGLTWDTPAGDYEVLGKQKMTISYYDDWYMPNYLPIGTINGYKFGFHAIPYHMDGAGNIYSRDPNTMGSPATGGCIQLTDKDSLELFNWADVGTPVYIYE